MGSVPERVTKVVARAWEAGVNDMLFYCSSALWWGIVIGILATIFVIPWILRFISWYYDKVLER